MRTENSVKNIKIGFIAQILSMLIQFISRTFFIKYLGVSYLGINGLFSNILTLLSLADLGIGNVLIFSMYKPISDKNEKQINLLMKEYKKIYNIIAFSVLIIGLCLTPFLHLFISSSDNVENLKLIFVLYLINTVVSYLCVYKISIINADQKQYIVTVTQQLFGIISNIVMILVLILTKNFILYLITQILFSILCNLYLNKKADKMYPFIKDKVCGNIEHEEKKQIFKDTKAMMLHKIGGVVVSGTDNIIMSYLINIATVGIYSNYLLIINSLKKFTNIFFVSISSSVGNLNAEKSKNYSYNIFLKIYYINYLIYSFSTICLICLFNPFISLWLGNDFVFNMKIVFCICLSFYIDGMRQSVLTFKDSMGLFQHDQLKPIVESVVNLIISIFLALKFGVIGIILGTIISMFFICVGTEAHVLFKYGFNKKDNDFFKLYFKYFVLGVIVLFICYCINRLIIINNFIGFILRIIIIPTLSFSLLILFTINTDEFKFIYEKFKERMVKNEK